MAKMNSYPVRVLAARVVLQVSHQGQSLGSVLLAAQAKLANPSESALLQEMCYGSLRWYYQLDAYLEKLLKKPMKERDYDLFSLLIVGLYQLKHMNIPAHAVVKETVNAVHAMRKDWAKGLVNALLREYQRRHEQLADESQSDMEAFYAHPQWMIERLKNDWPKHFEAVLHANNQRPPMTLRVNLQQTTAADYQRELSAKGIGCDVNTLVPSAVHLHKPVNVHDLPGFNTGRVSVQDAAAQLAASLMDLQAGMTVLDACCAPGGKTLHMLETMPDIKLTAVDVDAQRLQQVRENLQRAGLSVDLQQGDAAQPDSWWHGQAFDRILLDAPCSGSGVIRRHPDIKLLRRAEDINTLATRQQAMIKAIWPLLANGGMLVYVTCSVFKQEGEQQLTHFLQSRSDVTERVIEATWGHRCEVGRQILPDEPGMDGFYYACLEKNK